MKRTTAYASAWSRYSGSGCAVMTTTLAAGFLALISAMKSIPEPSGRFTSRTKKSISYSSRSIRASAKERAVRIRSSGMATCSVLANATAVTRSSSKSITQNLFIAKGGRRFLSVAPRVNPNPPALRRIRRLSNGLRSILAPSAGQTKERLRVGERQGHDVLVALSGRRDQDVRPLRLCQVCFHLHGVSRGVGRPRKREAVSQAEAPA